MCALIKFSNGVRYPFATMFKSIRKRNYLFQNNEMWTEIHIVLCDLEVLSDFDSVIIIDVIGTQWRPYRDTQSQTLLFIVLRRFLFIKSLVFILLWCMLQ